METGVPGLPGQLAAKAVEVAPKPELAFVIVLPQLMVEQPVLEVHLNPKLATHKHVLFQVIFSLTPYSPQYVENVMPN